jgi:hypothetical protein
MQNDLCSSLMSEECAEMALEGLTTALSTF